MLSEIHLLLLATLCVFGSQYIPPPYRYLSSRKRRAMRLALHEFSVTREHNKPDKPHSRIYKIDDEHCIVMIPIYCPGIHPPVLSFYSIPHGSDKAIHLGSGQCHWGIRPEDLWEYPDAVERVKRCVK